MIQYRTTGACPSLWSKTEGACQALPEFSLDTSRRSGAWIESGPWLTPMVVAQTCETCELAEDDSRKMMITG